MISERQGYFGGGGGMSGNLYMPVVRMEKNIYDSLRRKLSKLEVAEKNKEGHLGVSATTTQSLTTMAVVPDASVDYIYTDPPFGANIIYSEMNLILEGWLRVRTNDSSEAVIDPTRNRDDLCCSDEGVRECTVECCARQMDDRRATIHGMGTQSRLWRERFRGSGRCSKGSRQSSRYSARCCL